MIWLSRMKLQPARKDQLEELRSWFPNEQSLRQWAGPELPYSSTPRQFLEGIFWGKMPSLCTVDRTGKLLAFGQFYPRHDKCHLARLAVRPGDRGKGTGRQFIASLMAAGMKSLETKDCSLFVMSDNRAAVACYRSLGFEAAPWPGDVAEIAGVEFMVCLGANP